jgi:signal peptidase II
MRTSSKWLLLGLTISFALVDQASKWLAQTYLDPAHPLPLIPHVFQLTLAYNTGAAFSLLNNQPLLLTGFTSVVFIGLLVYGLTRPHLLKGELVTMALILGGALGNLIDRVRLGYVIDFLDLVGIHYPVFNVADSFIFCGVFLWGAIQLRSQPQETSSTGVTTSEVQREP